MHRLLAFNPKVHRAGMQGIMPGPGRTLNRQGVPGAEPINVMSIHPRRLSGSRDSG